MNFRFDFHRTLQASAVLLGLDANRMAYVRLLKLLYIADREWLAEAGRTITGDEAVAMKNGPVLSRVHDLIKGVAPRTDDWNDYIHKVDYSVELRKDPGRGKLSKGEIEKLTEVAERASERSTTGSCRSTRMSSRSGGIIISPTPARRSPGERCSKPRGKPR